MGPRAEDARVVQPRQVAHLLLRPRANHLARVLLPVALPEPELAGYVLVSENKFFNVVSYLEQKLFQYFIQNY